jgi:putative protease
LSLPVAAINDLRRRALAELIEKRRILTPPRVEALDPGLKRLNSTDAPVFTVSVRSAAQLSRELIDLRPAVVYIPADELSSAASIRPYMDATGVRFAVMLPRVIRDAEKPRLSALLTAAKKLGFTDALCGGIGSILMARELGFAVRGDFGMNVFNSQALRCAADLRLASQTLSFELNMGQIRDLSKPIDTEVIAYGRLPLMLTENCIIKLSAGCSSCETFSGLSDRLGVTFPVVREGNHRSALLNSKKLYMADKLSDLYSLGLWGLRLMFTTENDKECLDVYRSYLGDGNYVPGGFTRGLYYKGVE